MPRVSPIQSAFNAGELSPLIHQGRSEVSKYKAGLVTCLNYLPLIQGPLTRRPGTYFVAPTKNSGSKKSRLVAFEFSTTQAYVLEFGHTYVRFFTNEGQLLSSGSPYEVVTPYTETDLPLLRFTQSADVLYITHPNYPVKKLSRLAVTNWTLTDLAFQDGPYLSVNTSTVTMQPSAMTGGAVTLTASAATFVSTDVGRHIRLGYFPKDWTASTTWPVGAVVKSDSGKIYTCTTAGTGSTTAPAGYGTAITDGSAVWRYITDSGERWGWAIITAVTDSTHATVNVQTVFVNTTATLDWRMGLYGTQNGYPACSTFYDDRLVFAGCPQYPQRVDFSGVSNYETFSPTNNVGVTSAAEGFSITLNSRDVQTVRWMAGDDKGLLVGTAGGEWSIRPASNNDAMSALNVTAKQTSRYGSANIAPVNAGRAALFVQRAGRKLREMAFVIDVDGYKAPDMTALADHITRGGITELAFQKELNSVVWAVRSDGVLLGFTYDRDQEVVAWHRHQLGGTNAAVESVACIPSSDGTRDELWVQVRRTVGGQTVRHVEYMTKTWEPGDTQAAAFFVDCGATYNGAPVSTVSGLTWLEGQTVQILADGAVHPPQVVTSGAVALQTPASRVNVGLGYNSDAQTCRYDAGASDGTAQGKTRRINHLAVRVIDTLGLKVGRTFNNLDPVVFRKVASSMTSAAPLFTGDVQADWDGDYDFDGFVCWRQDQPTPGTIAALMPTQNTYDRG